MQTQRALSRQIIKANGDFVWIVKDNQRNNMRQAIELLFASEKAKPRQGCPPMVVQKAKTHNKDHGRIEERKITDRSMLNDYLSWPSAHQVFKMERYFSYPSTSKIHQETQYAITSLKAEVVNPEKMLALVRSEWGIENGLHYRHDVTFGEDKTRMIHKIIARSIALVNNFVIALLNTQGFTNHAQARRMFEAKPSSTITLLARL
jgi:predicted transposase YbfD/YdcC